MALALRRLRQALVKSQQLQRMTVKADRRLARRAYSKVFLIWKQKFEQVRSLPLLIPQIQVQQERRIAQHALHIWRLRCRSNVLRQALDGRTQVKYLTLWRKRVQDRQTQADEGIRMLTQVWNQRCRTRILDIWKDKVSCIRSHKATAEKLEAHVLLTRVWTRWSSRAVSHARLAQTAERLNVLLTLRRKWWIWRARLEELRVRTIQQRQERIILARALAAWRHKTVYTIYLREVSLQVETTYNQDLLRSVIRAWIERVVDERVRLGNAGAQYDAQLVNRIWSAMRSRIIAQHKRDALLQTFHAHQRRQLLGRTLERWYQGAGEQQARKTLISRRTQDLLRRVLTKWYDQTRDVLLREKEYEVFLSRGMRAMSNALHTWEDRTLSLDLVRRRNDWLKQQALERWLDLLPLAQARNEALAFDRHKLIADAFGIMRHECKQRATFRAAARFGGASTLRLRALSARLRVPSSRFVSAPKREEDSSQDSYLDRAASPSPILGKRPQRRHWL